MQTILRNEANKFRVLKDNTFVTVRKISDQPRFPAQAPSLKEFSNFVNLRIAEAKFVRAASSAILGLGIRAKHDLDHCREFPKSGSYRYAGCLSIPFLDSPGARLQSASPKDVGGKPNQLCSSIRFFLPRHVSWHQSPSNPEN